MPDTTSSNGSTKDGITVTSRGLERRGSSTIKSSCKSSQEKHEQWMKERKERLFGGNQKEEQNVRRGLTASKWSGVSNFRGKNIKTTTPVGSKPKSRSKSSFTDDTKQGAQETMEAVEYAESESSNQDGTDRHPSTTRRRSSVTSATKPGPKMTAMLRYISKT
ncbi:hypothetical protein L486_01960 [Kwoniella mangroviensis CBS 10435]|uniref:Uncharacterized protein n=1 Tax=Kwoniella mangroviensis CBS 10435 TaxID=1331196 RepID=A0A1B9J3C6_9TREE|nr:hypothetical protein L486_01960 [Kwoniella mangroviensis CBS 10435]